MKCPSTYDRKLVSEKTNKRKCPIKNAIILKYITELVITNQCIQRSKQQPDKKNLLFYNSVFFFEMKRKECWQDPEKLVTFLNSIDYNANFECFRIQKNLPLTLNWSIFDLKQLLMFLLLSEKGSPSRPQVLSNIHSISTISSGNETVLYKKGRTIQNCIEKSFQQNVDVSKNSRTKF